MAKWSTAGSEAGVYAARSTAAEKVVYGLWERKEEVLSARSGA